MQHAMEDVKRLNVMSANMFEQAKWEQFKVKLENGCKPLPHIPDATPKAIPKHIIRAVAGREPWLLWNIGKLGIVLFNSNPAEGNGAAPSNFSDFCQITVSCAQRNRKSKI